jgi:ornithine decarboxylase
LLAALGAGFDCASKNEILQVLALDVDPSQIIYANPCKATSFISNAAKVGVELMTFDNLDELFKVARNHPDAKLVVRILTDDSKALCRMGIKFGASLATVPSLLEKAKELGLDVVGVSFHVGSGCYDPTVYTDAIRRARVAFDMGKDAGFNFKLLDVGGGFEDSLFEKAASILQEAIHVYFPHRDGMRIIAEPGRFYVSTAFSLATNIIARRRPHLDTPAKGSDESIAMCQSLVPFLAFALEAHICVQTISRTASMVLSIASCSTIKRFTLTFCP